jgi:imidazolonepropionase-like amidohydrolase
VKHVAISILIFTLALPLAGQIAVRGETIYTLEGNPIHDGVVVIDDGRIVSVGPWNQTQIPSGYKVLSAKIVTPGLIDARSTVGLTGYLNQPHDQDHVDPSEPIQPELRAIDAYDSRERLIEWVRQFGVTTIHTGHSPSALISGQTMIVKTWGDTVEEAVLVPEAMIVATLGPAAFGEGGKSPGTRPKEVALLRAKLLEASNYTEKLKQADVTKRPEKNLRLEALSRVIAGEMPLLITANRAHDIMTALRIAEEFSIPIVIDGAAEAYLVLEELERSGVRLIVHPTMVRHFGEMENASFETPARLRKGEIPFALQSGYESYVPKTRVVLFEAAIAAANGLAFEEALASITIDAATILGIADRVGSLAPGKDADLVLFDGDPFEYTSRVTGVIINGELVEDQPW